MKSSIWADVSSMATEFEWLGKSSSSSAPAPVPPAWLLFEVGSRTDDSSSYC